MTSKRTFNGANRSAEDLYVWFSQILEEQAAALEASLLARINDFDDPSHVAELVAEARAAIDTHAVAFAKRALDVGTH